MEIMFMAFMIIVAVMMLFAVMIVLRDIVKEMLLNKAKSTTTKKEQEVKVVEVVKEVEKEPVSVEPTVEEVAATDEVVAPVEDDDDKISFSTNAQQTLDEKYLELSAQAKGWYDELVKTANVVENSKRIKNARYEEYKVGNSRIIRLTIKRGVIHTEFLLHNSEFNNFVNENKISVKQAPTVIKLVDDVTFQAAKNSINIVLQQIAQEKEYKKQLAREKRKAREKAKDNA